MPLAGLALAVVGTGLSMAGAARARSAMNKTRSAYAAKTAELDRQSDEIFKKSLAKSRPQDAQEALQKGEADRVNAWEALQQASTPIASALPASGTTDTATGKNAKRAGSAAATWNQLNAKAAAKQGAYGDWQTQQALKDSDASQQLSVVNNFARGNAAILPGQLESASHAGDGLSAWGSIVSSLGSIAGAMKAPVGASAMPAGTTSVTGVDGGVGFGGADVWDSVYGNADKIT